MLGLKRFLGFGEKIGGDTGRLYRKFEADPDSSNLAELLASSLSGAAPLQLDRSSFRAALHQLTAWRIDERLLQHLADRLQEHLTSHAVDATSLDWRLYLDVYEHLRKDVPLTPAAIVSGLSAAMSADKQGKVFGIEHRRRIASTVDRSALAVIASHPGETSLAAFYAVTVLAEAVREGRCPEARAAVERWWEKLAVRPRPLTLIPDEEALRSSVRGIGSPNGMAVTFFHCNEEPTPSRIVVTGRTPDGIINSWLDEGLFSLALACTSEPTILSENGAVLSTRQLNATPPRESILLPIELSPSGPKEPTAKSAPIGLSAEDALLITREVFERIESSAGLLQTATWDERDAEELDGVIRKAFETPEPMSVRSAEQLTEKNTALHAVRLATGNSNSGMEGISIAVPKTMLGTAEVFDVLRGARSTYLERLIHDVGNREKVAREAKEQHEQAIRVWKAYSEELKEAECRRVPHMEVTQRYDFSLGILVRLPKPELVRRREYEESVRPRIVEGATDYERKFKAIRERLIEIGKPGGRADLLTMKMLVDAAIRGARLPLPDKFQGAFSRWADVSGAALWAYVAIWCARSNYPLEDLARDNVVYNVRVDHARSSILLEPWAIVDLHDYEIEVDSPQGRMTVRSGTRCNSLEGLMIPDESLGIRTPIELREAFRNWLLRNPYPTAIVRDDENHVLSRGFVFGEHRVPIVFALAKGLLYAGQWQRARNLLMEIRGEDRPEIYFLAAVAVLAGSGILQRRPEYARISREADAHLKAQQECVLATELLTSSRDMDLLPGDCRRLLEQLVSRDPMFLAKLLEQPSRAHALVGIRTEGERHPEVKYATAAAASLELLAFADTAQERAMAMPASGSITGVVRRDLDELARLSDQMAFCQAPAAARFEELRKALS